MTIVNDDSSVVSKWSFKLIDNPRVAIYDRNRFIIQATDFKVTNEYSKMMFLDLNQVYYWGFKSNKYTQELQLDN